MTDTESSGDVWRIYLNKEFRKRATSFSWTKTRDTIPKWSGNIADDSGDKNPVTNPMAYPLANGDGVYAIYFPEQLAMALHTPFLVNYKIMIMQDMDMVGYEKEWAYAPRLSGFSFDGGGHTIYNIGSKKAFIDTLTNKSVLKNISFESAKLVSEKTGTKLLGIVGDFTSNIGDETQVINIRIQNSMFFSSYNVYAGSTVCYVAPLCDSKGIMADQVASYNNTVYAVAAHAGGAFGIVLNATISNSYSIDTTVIAGGNHSGGFVSCSDGGINVSSCFTNNIVLGNKETGVFIGALVDNNFMGGDRGDTVTNCYTSGSIEGQNRLGGFVGYIDTPYLRPAPNYTFKNCYSTSIVGVQNGGTDLGGFLGSQATGINITFASTMPSPVFTTSTSKKERSVAHGNPLNMAFKPVNTGAIIDRIDFEFVISDITSNISIQKIEITNIELDKEYDIPISYYYTSYEENGNYYAKKTKTIKKYTLKSAPVNGCYYLTIKYLMMSEIK